MITQEGEDMPIAPSSAHSAAGGPPDAASTALSDSSSRISQFGASAASCDSDLRMSVRSGGGRLKEPQVRIGVWRLPPHLGSHPSSAVSGPAEPAGLSAYADSVLVELREKNP